MKIKKILLIFLFLLSGCNLSYNEEFYLETVNCGPIFNLYGKQNFLEHHINILPNDTTVYIFKSIDDIAQMIDASVYFEKLTDSQTFELEKIFVKDYVVFVPIVLCSSAEFKCKLFSEEETTNLTFVIGPFLDTEEFFTKRYTAKIPKEYVDDKIINYKFEIIN